jgi:hypothetical protein
MRVNNVEADIYFCAESFPLPPRKKLKAFCLNSFCIQRNIASQEPGYSVDNTEEAYEKNNIIESSCPDCDHAIYWSRNWVLLNRPPKIRNVG